jgi:hypothetical protein
MTSRLIAGAAVAALLLCGGAQAEGPLKSGPPVGARNDRSGFLTQLLTGPTTGQTLCPV